MDEQRESPEYYALDSFGEPAWFTTSEPEIAKARDSLLGDYNMWVNLSGGSRDTAKQLFLKDYPRGPLGGLSDDSLRAHLADRFPWLWAYIAFQYRAGIFNTLTFLVMVAILVYIALVYVPRDQRQTSEALEPAVQIQRV